MNSVPQLQTNEISDEDLDNVSGGTGDPNTTLQDLADLINQMGQ